MKYDFHLMTNILSRRSKTLLNVSLIGIFMISAIPISGFRSGYGSRPLQAGINVPVPRILVGEILSIPLTLHRMFSQSGNSCYVSPNQTVVEWKGTYYAHCRMSLEGLCVWPFSHKHITYKVTIDEGIPLRDHRGGVVPATNGEKRNSWLTYDSESWNALEFDPWNDYYIDFDTIAPNEYIVMVETRYRLFNDVGSTLGICMQQP